MKLVLICINYNNYILKHFMITCFIIKMYCKRSRYPTALPKRQHSALSNTLCKSPCHTKRRCQSVLTAKHLSARCWVAA